MTSEPHGTVRPVGADEWDVVAWLWQAFRHDLAPIVGSFPYADGRYRHDRLDGYPAPDREGWLLTRPHPHDGRESPVGFALVRGLDDDRLNLSAFFVVPVLRGRGVGTSFALDVIARHEGAWQVAFQHDNPAAGRFWRRVATTAFGREGVGWREDERPVPDKPGLPPDHWIESI